MSVRVSEAAIADVSASSAAYDRKPERHGAAFEAEVERALARIGENPRLYALTEDAPVGREFREFFIERFQQRVIYQVSGDDALVVAVVHAARKPGAWHRNLPTDPPETT